MAKKARRVVRDAVYWRAYAEGAFDTSMGTLKEYAKVKKALDKARDEVRRLRKLGRKARSNPR